MKCPRCHSFDSKVLESRLSQDGRILRRRRSCRGCDFRFTTYEKEELISLQVLKKDGHIEPYQRDKALRSLQIACQKRNVPIEELEFLLSKIEKSLQELGDPLVPSRKLGKMLLKGLHQLDKVSYVRFASVYQDFKNPSEFLSVLSDLHLDPEL